MRELTLSDGAPDVAGYRTFGTTGIGDTRYSGSRSARAHLVVSSLHTTTTRLRRWRRPRSRIWAVCAMTVDAVLGLSAENSLDVHGSVLYVQRSASASISVFEHHLKDGGSMS